MVVNGNNMFVASYWNNNVTIIDTDTGNLIKTIDTQANPSRLAVNSDATRVYVVAANNVSSYDVASGSPVASVTLSGAQGLALSQDGTTLYVTSGTSNSVNVLNATTLATITTVAVAANPSASRSAATGSMSSTRARAPCRRSTPPPTPSSAAQQ